MTGENAAMPAKIRSLTTELRAAKEKNNQYAQHIREKEKRDMQ